ncbi:MAG: hypothetical protein CSA62_08910 [Planctomycetota bacterium]|nr:MAG: hypothetical protein CSA62_08910 [Planctomycetota bacterium]
MSERVILPLPEALERILSAVPASKAEELGLGDALRRILLQDVYAAEDVPLADVSAMDGFALRTQDLATGAKLQLVGDAFAGQAYEGSLPPGSCVRVMTGGLIPEGADTVVPVEKSSGYEPLEGGVVRFDAEFGVGANIRKRACVRSAGQQLLESGTEIRPAVVGVLANQGLSRVQVAVQPRVAILPTGDEVVAIEEQPGPGQVRNSNAWALAAQVTACGGLPSMRPVLGDDEALTREQLAAALREHDLVLTIGGVSMGTKDLVRGAFEALGGECLVESVLIKPGKPSYFGRIVLEGRESFLLGLPGNPASSFTIFALLGEPFLRVFQGESRDLFEERNRGRLHRSSLRKNRRLQALPGRLWQGPEATVVEALPEVNSADLFVLADADLLFLVPAGETLQDGESVEWLPLP